MRGSCGQDIRHEGGHIEQMRGTFCLFVCGWLFGWLVQHRMARHCPRGDASICLGRQILTPLTVCCMLRRTRRLCAATCAVLSLCCMLRRTHRLCGACCAVLTDCVLHAAPYSQTVCCMLHRTHLMLHAAPYDLPSGMAEVPRPQWLSHQRTSLRSGCSKK